MNVATLCKSIYIYKKIEQKKVIPHFPESYLQFSEVKIGILWEKRLLEKF